MIYDSKAIYWEKPKLIFPQPIYIIKKIKKIQNGADRTSVIRHCIIPVTSTLGNWSQWVHTTHIRENAGSLLSTRWKYIYSPLRVLYAHRCVRKHVHMWMFRYLYIFKRRSSATVFVSEYVSREESGDTVRERWIPWKAMSMHRRLCHSIMTCVR